MTPRALVAAVLLALATPSAHAGERLLHMDVDVAYQRGTVGFVAVALPRRQCTPETCSLPGIRSLRAARLVAGIGWGSLTLEASLAFPITDGTDYFSWTAGLRVETSPASAVGISFRAAYVERIEPAAGIGGQAGLAFLLRFHQGLHLYAEATVEGTTVPSAMQSFGTLFSYSTMVGCGVRMSLR